MSDNYLMDGHKLIWHLDRVKDWNEGKRIAPLHIDVGLSKGCNIRCQYCFGALQGNSYQKGAGIYFPREALLRYVREAGEIGVRSMALIGEGEPLLNPHVYEAMVEGARCGVDMSLGSNGLLLDTGRNGERALEHLKWIRFNISAASAEAYARIHGSDDFEIACEKIRFCVAYKKKQNLPVTVGLQMVLIPGNVDQLVPLARLGAELGVDYLVIKQCSDTIDNDLKVYNQFNEYATFSEVLAQAESLSNSDYQVIVKWGKITNNGKRGYQQCLGAPFLLYSSGDGRLYPCGMFFDREEETYRLGDLTTHSFKQIIESPRYWEVMDRVARLDVRDCYSNCRTHAINEFAWKLKHPPEHVNFV